MKTTGSLLVFLALSWAAIIEDDPDYGKDPGYLVTSKGYPLENYTVQTEDGYLLTLFRIPHGRSGSPNTIGEPLLIPSGLLLCLSFWVLNFPNQSIAFVMADAGYDVWLLGFRGCTQSRKHISLSTESKEYWDFSFEELGTKDLPAAIDFILEKTNKDKLYYIGYSMAGTACYVLLSLKPEYTSKFRLVTSMSPIANLSNTQGFIKYFAPVQELFYYFDLLLFNGAFLTDPALNDFFGKLCRVIAVQETFCSAVYLFVASTSPEQLNKTREPVYFDHFPAGASGKQIYHYTQVYKAKQLLRFNYGKTKNLEIYGQEEPPQYPLENITAPMALYWGGEDIQAHPDDVASLNKRLPNVVEFYKVQCKTWKHFDFSIGIDAKKCVYDYMITLMKKY